MLENAMEFRGRDGYDLLDNPGSDFGGLMLENQVFSMSALRAFGTAGVGVGFGLVFASFLDRYVATRKPTNGTNPWLGANAAAAQNRRPDAWRLGAQAAGGLGAMALAYATRGRSILPWVLGGTAVGFFANLTQQLITWWGMPMILKVQSPTEATFANRMYPLEQKSVQDTVDSLFEGFASNALRANQPATGDPTVMPVAPSTAAVYTLGRGQAPGKARTQADAGNGQVGQPVLVPTGRLGTCASCKGDNGCWSWCQDVTWCGDRPGWPPTARMCEYEVQPGDDLMQMSRLYGIDVGQVNALNPPGNLAGYWVPGRKVKLPYAFCRALETGLAGAPSTPMVPGMPVPIPRDYGRIGDPKPNGSSAGLYNLFRDEE